jgi:Putative peptidoglycan binding domain
MFASVQNTFRNFNAPFEGVLEFMYLDVKGLVTIGIGNLIDPAALAQQLPFFSKGNSDHLATSQEIADDWNRVKARQDLKERGGGAFRDIALLRISQQTIDGLVSSKLSQNEATLKLTPEFARFDAWPADAQLGLLSMAWAMGPAFASGWPMFRAACASENWDAAADASRISEVGNPGVAPRNRANKILFTNAARVKDEGRDIATLFYPQILTPGIPPISVTSTVNGWPLAKANQPNRDYLVRTLQWLLNEHGMSTIISGSFEVETDLAVKSFQASQGLESDGVVGEKTWQKLIVTKKAGDMGNAVSAIQNQLLTWDINLSFSDSGEFDLATDQAVKEFQTLKQLTSDGIVGPMTWKALLNV